MHCSQETSRLLHAAWYLHSFILRDYLRAVIILTPARLVKHCSKTFNTVRRAYQRLHSFGFILKAAVIAIAF